MLGERWMCPSCHRPVLLDRHGALFEHAMLPGADMVWRCKGSGFNIFEETRPQLIARGLKTAVKKTRKKKEES